MRQANQAVLRWLPRSAIQRGNAIAVASSRCVFSHHAAMRIRANGTYICRAAMFAGARHTRTCPRAMPRQTQDARGNALQQRSGGSGVREGTARQKENQQYSAARLSIVLWRARRAHAYVTMANELWQRIARRRYI